MMSSPQPVNIHRPTPKPASTTRNMPQTTTPSRPRMNTSDSQGRRLSPQRSASRYNNSKHNDKETIDMPPPVTYALPQPPSRSERLLRDALRKDEARVTEHSTSAFETAMSPPLYSPSRNTDVVRKPSVRRNATYSGPERRSSNATPTPATFPTQEQTQTYFDSKQPSTHAHSPPSSSTSLPLTPHEAVLRARLERVLMACEECEHREQRNEGERSRSRSRSRSSSPAEDNMWSNRIRSKQQQDSGWGWTWGSPPTQPNFEHVRSRSQTVPTLNSLSSEPSTVVGSPPSKGLATPSTASTSKTNSRFNTTSSRASHVRTYSSGSVPPKSPSALFQAPPLEKVISGDGEVVSESRLLTPPPTPPHERNRELEPLSAGPVFKTMQTKRMSPVRAHTTGSSGLSSSSTGIGVLSTSPTTLSLPSALVSSPLSHSFRPAMSPSQSQSSPRTHSSSPQASPTFNAQVASEQCRAIEGYVSFSSIEGLGVPDGWDEREEEALAREKGTERKEGERVLEGVQWELVI